MNAKQILTTVASAIAMSLIGNVAQAQANCPKAGELKSFAQITAQAEVFNGCDVTTEVRFVATGKGNNMFAAYSFDGETVFRVMPLGQVDIETYGISIANSKADPVFTLKTGDILRLRGSIDFRKFNNYDVGNASRLFRAQSIEVVKK
ncbi:MAG: hypothetical protein ACK5U6_04485 [Pseudanabaena sp.]|jgi:hypothetical protein|nr:hypothetical protein [Pseudanabaena sp. M051S1SP1A06QC]